jgi:hypothetical protein
MVVERDDEGFERWPAAPDAVAQAFGQLFAVIFECFPDTSSADHRDAMMAALDLHRRLRMARQRPKLH